MSVSYTALVRAQDVDDEMEGSSDLSISDGFTLKTMESVIEGITSTLEGASGLNRNLIVRQYTDYFVYEDWAYDEGRDKWWVYAPQWPVVEIDTSGFTTGIPSGETEARKILYTSRFEGSVTYYAGYARSDQSLAGLQNETNLSNLGTLPGTLPNDIRDAAIDLVLYKMHERRQGPGSSSRTHNAAVGVSTVTEPQRGYIDRVVRERIWHHRRLPC